MSRTRMGGTAAGEALPPLVAVMGPTASGKSALALELAEAFGGEIVNTDALQVYRHFDIGTAKATAAERARVPHHLLDVAEPDEGYSAGRYVSDARAAIAAVVARGRVPILCGGTGLYYRALLYGLAAVPAVPGAVQAAVEARIAEEGIAAAHAALRSVDAEAAARIHPNDPVRIARALAVYEATGQPLSAYQQAEPFAAAAPDALAVGLCWERRALAERIGCRVRDMLARGWIEEVQGLLARGYGPELRPMRAIGYREIVTCLREGGAREALAEGIAQRTRQYAKRQRTWFRRHPEINWEPPERRDVLLAAVRNFLLPDRGRG